MQAKHRQCEADWRRHLAPEERKEIARIEARAQALEDERKLLSWQRRLIYDRARDRARRSIAA